MTTGRGRKIRDITTFKDGARVDNEGVRRLAAAMQRKLKVKRQQGRGGWQDPQLCSVESLRSMMSEHIKKGDVTDIANFCMMIWNKVNPTGRSHS